MTAFGTVLVYDGDCPFCSAAAAALGRTRDVGVVAWDDEAAQAFLAAQFGEVPFALVLVDGEHGTVYVGREAARELCGRAGLPALVEDLVRDSYETVAGTVRTVSGQERDPDPYHATVPLSPAAGERLDALAAAAEDPTPPAD